MSTFNALIDFPETYIYNNYNQNNDINEDLKSVNIDIDQIVFELLKTGKNKEKFELIMENLEREFLGEEKLSDDENEVNANITNRKETFTQRNNEHEIFRKDTIYSTIQQTERLTGGHIRTKSSSNEVDGNNNTFSNNRNMNNYYNNFQSSSGKQMTSNLTRMNTNLNSQRQNNMNYKRDYNDEYIQNKTDLNINLNTKNNQNVIHRKYTDVHANTKYHYPKDFYNGEESDYSFDKSQWTDRANSSVFYKNTDKNLTNLLNTTNFREDNPSDYYNRNNTGYDYNTQYKFNRDNTNSALFNMQMKKFK
jgi:hypothetical protein